MDEPAKPTPPAGGDPSMEDILASIRRILSEDERGEGPAAPAQEPPADSGVLVLDQSMMVPDTHAPHPAPENPMAAETSTPPEPMRSPVPSIPPTPAASHAADPHAADPRPGDLVAPETAAATASSLGALVRRISAERGTAVSRGGPTIEDLVREEIRPVLKDWLDTHLPPLVERLVRAEIERVVGRADF
jgi:cell pole-organizing protein PopZ